MRRSEVKQCRFRAVEKNGCDDGAFDWVFLFRFLGRDPVSGFKILKPVPFLSHQNESPLFWPLIFHDNYVHKDLDNSNRFIHTKKSHYASKRR